ncbi:hypothetical protein WSS_A41820 [Rhodococcus opacus M213]|uniref:Peptidase M48 domain-containing protein n=1 Tax=Rhodococcus opacus M213 TaxID=1129896 RepID=K8X526_RHOOP|nr:hypothetical protein WSS_A41820 [Rhodococcus opacus M213]
MGAVTATASGDSDPLIVSGDVEEFGEVEFGYVTVVQHLCDRTGHVPHPEVLFDEKKALGVAAYHPRRDELALDPAFLTLGLDFAESYAFDGVIVHELGHRTEPGWIVLRRWLFWASAVVSACVGLYTYARPFNDVCAVLMFIALLLFLCIWPVSWNAEFRADDYMCDVAGIGVAVCTFDLLAACNAQSSVTHPPTSLRLARQLRRAKLPHARRNRESILRRGGRKK